jgi:hypothetical protein
MLLKNREGSKSAHAARIERASADHRRHGWLRPDKCGSMGATSTSTCRRRFRLTMHHLMTHNASTGGAAMGAITVRNLSPEVARAVREKAKREKLSLNRAVVKLLEEATGASGRKAEVVHHDLDRFFGTWTKEQADAFDETLREQRRIDPEMWR